MVFEARPLGGGAAFLPFGGLHLPPPGLRLSLRRWGALLALAGLALPGVQAASAGVASDPAPAESATAVPGEGLRGAPAPDPGPVLPLGDPWEAVVTEPPDPGPAAPPAVIPPVTSAPVETARSIPPTTAAPATAPVSRAKDSDLVPASREYLRPLLARYAAENKLPADLVMSLAWKESSWRPGAVSRAGALGVMQLMPTTVTFVSRDLMGLTSNLNPHNATANIRMGTRFLAHLVKVYDGSYRRALIAYNQGVTALRVRGSYPGAERFADSVLALRSEFRA